MSTEAEASHEEGSEAARKRKQRSGTVVAANAQKTVMVVVERRVRHQQYGKYITERKKYPVHDMLGCQVGETVRIEETRPISKTKRWRVVERVAHR